MRKNEFETESFVLLRNVFRVFKKVFNITTKGKIVKARNIFISIASLDPLRNYKADDVIIQLPGEMTVFNIDWLSIYDVKSKTNFGSVLIPDGLNVPPSLVKVSLKIFISMQRYTCNTLLFLFN